MAEEVEPEETKRDGVDAENNGLLLLKSAKGYL